MVSFSGKKEEPEVDCLVYYYNGSHDIYEWFHSQVKKKSQSGGSCRVEQR